MYLKGTQEKGTIFWPIKGKYIEVYLDADFAGNWKKNEIEDPDTTILRHGYFIMYTGCPLLKKPQLQTECDLYSIDSEYNRLS